MTHSKISRSRRLACYSKIPVALKYSNNNLSTRLSSKRLKVKLNLLANPVSKS